MRYSTKQWKQWWMETLKENLAKVTQPDNDIASMQIRLQFSAILYPLPLGNIGHPLRGYTEAHFEVHQVKPRSTIQHPTWMLVQVPIAPLTTQLAANTPTWETREKLLALGLGSAQPLLLWTLGESVSEGKRTSLSVSNQWNTSLNKQTKKRIYTNELPLPTSP